MQAQAPSRDELEELRRLLERLHAENAMLRAGNEVLRARLARVARATDRG
jgi:regulator of replication initiation timing